jgi:hypothetical protein
MKKKLYLMIIFATILIASVMLQFQTYASPGPTIYLDPSNYIFDADTVSIGHQFNVTIRVKDLAKLMMFQVYLTFDDSIINVTQFTGEATGREDAIRAWPNDDLEGRSWDSQYVFYNKAGGMVGNPSYYHLGPGRGAVKIGDTLFSDATLNTSKTYKLASIELTITKMPPEGGKLSCTLGINNTDTYLYEVAGQISGVTKMDGYYELSSKVSSHNLAIQVNNPSWGSTTPSGTISMMEGESRNIQANPNSGYALDHWELDGVNKGSANPYKVTMGTKDMTLLAVFAVFTPPAGARLSIDPPEIIDPTMVPCSTFSINVTIAAVEKLLVCRFNLSYNTEILDMVGIKFHKVLDQTPKAKIISDDEAGYIWIQLNYLSPITTSPPLAIVTIEFHVIALGASPLDLHDTELFNDTGQPITHVAEDGFFATLIRDVAVVNVIPSRQWVYQGTELNITVTVKNKGMINETFEVKTFYNSELIETATIVDLPPNNETTIIVSWNTQNVTACNNYTIKAEATAVPSEFNITDNIYTDGFVKVRFLGDINGDGKVDMMDIYIVTKAFGSYPGHPRWHPDADVDQNNLIDMRDTWLTAKNFGKECNP